MNSSQGLRGFITFMILLAILGTGIAGFNYVSIPTNTTSEADQPKIEPINVSVINITDASAEITWTTVDPTSAKLVFSKNLNAECLASSETSQDCRYIDLNDPQTAHKAQLTMLDTETTYFFRIWSNDKLYPTDTNHTFRTTEAALEPYVPVQQESSTEDEFDGFGDVNTEPPSVNQVLGVSDELIEEPIDPLGDIDKMMAEEFKEAMLYNTIQYDFNSDGKVTMADYPLFIESVMNYNE